jgi:hypothetical protein
MSSNVYETGSVPAFSLFTKRLCSCGLVLVLDLSISVRLHVQRRLQVVSSLLATLPARGCCTCTAPMPTLLMPCPYQGY